MRIHMARRWPFRLAKRTPPSQGGDVGLNPTGVTIKKLNKGTYSKYSF